MNISIIGIGYVGLVTGTCLADLGMKVICMDNDAEKIRCLNEGGIPIFESGLSEIIKRNTSLNKLHFSTDIKKTIMHSEVIFLAVGTPMASDGSADLQFVFQAARNIAEYMNDYKVIVTKSTVPVGTAKLLKEEIEKILNKRKKKFDFDIVSNPEFLREGSAIKDFNNPDRIVIGAGSKKAISIMKDLYKSYIQSGVPIIITNNETAEMVKYASNVFLAAKVSFINEIANICELCNADVTTVAKAMGLDNRIGSKFLSPGPGYGGSCFPKDVSALISLGNSLGYTPKIAVSVMDVNTEQKKRMYKKIKKAVGRLKNKTITILGVSFKPDTSDIRESPSISIINELLKKEAVIKVYDPEAMENLKQQYPNLPIVFCNNVFSACTESDCIVLVTDWKQFSNIDFHALKSIVRKPLFIDLRNVYNPSYVRQMGFMYKGVGRQ